jgi:hypothetical protein
MDTVGSSKKRNIKAVRWAWETMMEQKPDSTRKKYSFGAMAIHQTCRERSCHQPPFIEIVHTANIKTRFFTHIHSIGDLSTCNAGLPVLVPVPINNCKSAPRMLSKHLHFRTSIWKNSVDKTRTCSRVRWGIPWAYYDTWGTMLRKISTKRHGRGGEFAMMWDDKTIFECSQTTRVWMWVAIIVNQVMALRCI